MQSYKDSIPAGNATGSLHLNSKSRTKVTVFSGQTIDDKRPHKTIRNSVNKSQIFYPDRQDTFCDNKSKRMSQNRNSSQIGSMDMPDTFESHSKRGRNHLTQVKRNKTTIFEPPENKPIKKVYNRSSNNGRDPLPKALQENNIGSILRD